MDSLSPIAAAQLADDTEAAAFRDMFAQAAPPLAQRLGLRVAEVAGATLLIAPALPTPMFNRAIGLGLHRPATVEDAAAIAETYRAAGVSQWWLHWNPHGAPQGFGAELEKLGWRSPPRRSWAKMLRATANPPAFDTTLRVEAVDGEDAKAAARVAVQAFEMPPFMADWLACLHGTDTWRTFALRDGDAIVGGGYLYLGDQAGWLGVAGVAPTHRGRKGQASLMAHRIAAARDAGRAWAVTETGEPTEAGEANPSLANMKRCGFQQVASRLNYAAPA